MYYGMDNHYEKSESEGIRHHTIVLQSLSLHEYLDSETVLDGQVPYSKTQTISQHSVNVLLSHYAHCKRSQKLIHIARQKSAPIRL